MHKIKTDVLIIGAGAAGIRAALAASEAGIDVLMVAKGAVSESGSTFSPITKGWGIQALIGNERTKQNLEGFYNEIIRVGLGACEPGLIRILVEESGPRFEDLLSYGMRFKKDATGKYVRAKGCFSRTDRAFLTESYENIRQTFCRMLKSPNVTTIQGQALELIIADSSCWGSWIHTKTGNIIQINAKATILATGGGAGIFLDNLVGEVEKGDGYALAHKAGAKFRAPDLA